MLLNVKNEYGCLESVVVSSAEYYDEKTLALNNETIKYYQKIGGVPTKEAILREQKEFWDTLKNLGVDVIEADQVNDSKGQMFTRDLAFVIGDTFFISNMKKENRKKAIDGWSKIIKEIDPKKVVRVPSDIYLEGGDVLVDDKKVYVGISERTNMDGVRFLKSILKDYTIIPLKLNPKFLHLDVVFTIINPNLAIVYKDALEEDSYKLLEEYKKIELTQQEQFELGTNVLVVDPNTIIVNKNHQRIKTELEKLKFKVISVDLSETAKDGGAFRCTTCPLKRGL